MEYLTDLVVVPVSEFIPSNQADFVALVIARDDYKTRKERDDANAL